ncbi:MAG: 5-(carboxyamino)imidazole ribonucleotide mutase [Candidatus Atribacteria bacterium]|nr:5-(carboxyamino)imidazole ribonucleotide mutase [Candidatus Atribacteria bacterium]
MSVYVVIGSKNDLNYAAKCIELLDKFEINHRLFIASAHRTPEKINEILQLVEENHIQVIIAMAGYAAHLPGVLAARALCPVIGVPLDSSSLLGLDALFSIVQMPAGIPCACVGIGESGARNAAILAAEILSIQNSQLQEKIKAYREEMREAVIQADRELTF